MSLICLWGLSAVVLAALYMIDERDIEKRENEKRENEKRENEKRENEKRENEKRENEKREVKKRGETKAGGRSPAEGENVHAFVDFTDRETSSFGTCL
jgi:flagellar biosynthesis/type III secretory pathway M-ring protein FliF/YscJ